LTTLRQTETVLAPANLESTTTISAQNSEEKKKDDDHTGDCVAGRLFVMSQLKLGPIIAVQQQ